MNPSFEVIGTAVESGVFLTCEHASSVIPLPWFGWPAEDSWVVGLHWSIDIGAELMARELADMIRCKGIVAKFSRLLCDCNRKLDSPTLFRNVADGKEIALNKLVTEEERTKRLDLLYHPYHAAIDEYLNAHPAKLVFSIHSFTPEYEGSKRKVEVGMLHYHDAGLATEITEALSAQGMDARLNEPWSGKEGFMYSAQMHADKIGAESLMIEVRQDLILDSAYRHKVNTTLCEILKKRGYH